MDPKRRQDGPDDDEPADEFEEAADEFDEAATAVTEQRELPDGVKRGLKQREEIRKFLRSRRPPKPPRGDTD